MTPGQVLIWLVSAAIATFVSVRLGHRKGRTGLGWAMGLILGWIGVIVMLCVPKTFEAKVRDEREQQRIRQAAQQPPQPVERHWSVSAPLRKPDEEPELPRLIP